MGATGVTTFKQSLRHVLPRSFVSWYRARKPPALDDRNSQYDTQTAEVMRRVLKRDSCALDVGAHKGAILEEIMRSAPEGRHFAFEPLPHLAQDLRERFPTTRVLEVAVSDHSGMATFVHVENDPGYSGLRERIYDRPDPFLKEITVKVERIDDVVPTDRQIVFIKLDIEGGEYHALRGAAALIRRDSPVIVFEAGVKSTGQYGVKPEEMYRLITQDFGYHLSTMARWLSNSPPLSEATLSSNWYHGPEFYFIAYPANAQS